MTRTLRPVPVRTSRRRVLTAAGLASAGWLLSACDAPESPDSTASPGPGDPDELLLARARAAVVTAETFVVAVIATHPALARLLTPVRELHAAHAAVLEGPDPSPTPAPVPAPPPPQPPAPPPRRRARALRAVRAAEQEYAEALADGAGQAASGDLARMLASARAGVLMHLALLERDS